MHYMICSKLLPPTPPFLTSLDPLCSFGGYSLSLQEVAQRWPSKDTSSAGNDGENGQGSSEEEKTCPCHVRVSQTRDCCVGSVYSGHRLHAQHHINNIIHVHSLHM